MRIMNFKRFNEANGVELLNPGLNGNSLPNFPSTQTGSPMSRFGNIDTTVIEDKDGNFYTEDDFKDLHNEYLKNGGVEQISDFNKKNLDIILNYFTNIIN